MEYYCERLDLNQRPSAYEADELPDCSTPHISFIFSRPENGGILPISSTPPSRESEEKL